MMGVGAKRALGLYRSCAPRQWHTAIGDPNHAPNRSLSSHPWLRCGLKQRKGGLPTRQRFDERSPCQESVIGLRWNR